MSMHNDFFRLGVFSPQLRVGNVAFNVAEILALVKPCREQEVALAVFPELSLTAYTCGDMFFNTTLIADAERGLVQLARETAACPSVLVVGLPVAHESRLYNCAAVVQSGRILGIVPKSILPNYREFYEKRHFTSGAACAGVELHWKDYAEPIPFGTDLIFSDNALFRLGIEICEDLWSIHPPSGDLAIAGARIIANPSAGTEYMGKSRFRKSLVQQQSARCTCAYLLASAGVHESTSDLIFSGHLVIADSGEIVGENQRFSRESDVLFADIDLRRIDAIRRSESSFPECRSQRPTGFRVIPIQTPPNPRDLAYAKLSKTPFIPEDTDIQEILAIQCAGLVKRMEHTHCEKIVIGVSGGLDSTLALLVAVESCRMAHLAPDCVHAVTMPGFGTSAQTRNNAQQLCQLLGTSFEAIDIRKICRAQFEAIHFDEAQRTTVYENVQARVRTEILMNLANVLNGLVLGTGDLSEIALGWNTFNGDHMSMYAVNASLPKTLIQHLIREYAKQQPEPLRRLLEEIVATPISPELLPPDANGDIAQKTEALIGPYELHDFFLYHFIRYGVSSEKVLGLAERVFRDCYPPELIRATLKTFIRRLFSQQFKRNCMPDGSKVTSVSLSPRGDWRMPSDMGDAPFQI